MATVARRAGRRFTRGERQYIWTAVSFQGNNITVGGSPLEGNIVEGADWQRQANGRETCTLMAIRGTYSVTAEQNTSGQAKTYIAKFDEDEVSPNPLTVGTYVDEDILWNDCAAQQMSIELFGGRSYQLHVKAKRKISNKHEIRIVLGASVGGVFEFTATLRALLMIH